MKTLVVYLSQKGYMKEVSERISSGLNCEIHNLADGAPSHTSEYDNIVISAAIFARKYPAKMAQFCNNQLNLKRCSHLYFVVGGFEKDNIETYLKKSINQDILTRTKSITYAGAKYDPKEHKTMTHIIMKFMQGNRFVNETAWENIDSLVNSILESE